MRTATAPLTVRYRQRLSHHRAVAAGASVAAWDRLDSYDEHSVEAYALRAEPVVTAVRLRTAHLTAGYLGRVTATTTVAVTAAHLLLPVDWWRQPFMSTWAGFAAGKPFDDAVAAGRSRAEQAGEDAVTSAARSAAAEVDRRTDAITEWERVPSGNACAWCFEVAGQSYRSAESADFGHDRCSCVVTSA